MEVMPGRRSLHTHRTGKSRPLANQCGLSLIEVMVAMVLLGVGLVAAVGMAQSAEQGLHTASRATRALLSVEA